MHSKGKRYGLNTHYLRERLKGLLERKKIRPEGAVSER
jgi:hypothetical protein